MITLLTIAFIGSVVFLSLGTYLVDRGHKAHMAEMRKLTIQLSDGLDHVHGCSACNADQWEYCRIGGRDAYKAMMAARSYFDRKPSAGSRPRAGGIDGAHTSGRSAFRFSRPRFFFRRNK
jgi:hypothetical protein